MEFKTFFSSFTKCSYFELKSFHMTISCVHSCKTSETFSFYLDKFQNLITTSVHFVLFFLTLQLKKYQQKSDRGKSKKQKNSNAFDASKDVEENHSTVFITFSKFILYSLVSRFHFLPAFFWVQIVVSNIFVLHTIISFM